MNKLKKIYLKFQAYSNKKEEQKKDKELKETLKKKISSYYSTCKSSVITSEIKEALAYISQHGISAFPASFVEKYNASDIDVFQDESLNLRYVYWGKHKMYLPNGGSDTDIKDYLNGLRIEQDLQSPHRYLESNTFDIQEGNIVVDIGVAEGNFGLSVIEKCAHLYLFEADESWIEVLNATFKPWKEKVTIVNKYVSNRVGDGIITLDSFFVNKKYKVDFIKIDAEGAELDILIGAEEILRRNENLKLAVCAYHNKEDEEVLNSYLTGSFTISPVNGIMLFLYGKEGFNLQAPYFRKGVLRASKKNK